MRQENKTADAGRAGLGAWLLERLRQRWQGGRSAEPRLALLERIALAPRQSVALIEVEGRRFLVATSGEGSPAFLALEEARSGRSARKVSW